MLASDSSPPAPGPPLRWYLASSSSPPSPPAAPAWSTVGMVRLLVSDPPLAPLRAAALRCLAWLVAIPAAAPRSSIWLLRRSLRNVPSPSPSPPSDAK